MTVVNENEMDVFIAHMYQGQIATCQGHCHDNKQTNKVHY